MENVLSVIIPVYKVEQTLERCVKSVLNQGIVNMQVILVDDGSPDSCPSKCDAWAEKDSRIKVVHKENGGLSSARNAGLDVADGRFVTFVDSDDSIKAGTYTKVLSKFDRETDIVEYPVSKIMYYDDVNTTTTFHNKEYLSADMYVKETKAYSHFYSWNKIYRRTLFDDVRFPEGKVFEDAFTTPLLLSKSRKIKTTSEGLYLYEENPDGITNNAGGEELEMLLDAYIYIFKEYPKWVDDSFYIQAVNVQLDVCRETGKKAKLPKRSCSIAKVDGLKNKVKALIFCIFGLDVLCKVSRQYHNWRNK